MALVKEQGGWLWFNSSRDQNRKSRSSVFFCSETKCKRLLRAKAMFHSPTEAETTFIKTCQPGPALPQVGPLEVVCHQTCVGLETDLPTIQNTKKERFDRIKSLLPPSLPPSLVSCRELRQSEKRLGSLCWRLPGTSGATWLHGIGFIFKMAAIRCKVLCVSKNNLFNPEFSHLFREYRLLIFRINGHLFGCRCVTEVLTVMCLVL